MALAVKRKTRRRKTKKKKTSPTKNAAAKTTQTKTPTKTGQRAPRRRKETAMTEDTDPVAEGLRRAIEAADAANDAAEDVARLGKAQKEFVDRVSKAQKRSSAMATGATIGAVVSLALAGLVYLRSVGDLHEAADLQAEAAKLIAEEVMALKEARGEGGEQKEDPVKKLLEALPESVAVAVSTRMAEVALETPPPAAPDTGSVAAIEGARDEILTALAELDIRHLDGAAPAPEAAAAAPVADGEAAPVAAPAAGGEDLTDIRESLARIEAGMLRLTAAPAAPENHSAAPAAKPAAPKPPKASNSKPAAQPDSNPFSYP